MTGSSGKDRTFAGYDRDVGNRAGRGQHESNISKFSPCLSIASGRIQGVDYPRAMRALLVFFWLLGGAILTGLLLFTVGKVNFSNGTVALLLLHGVFGAAAASMAIVVAPGRWKRFWRRRDNRERRYALALYAALAVAGLTGVIFFVELYRTGNGQHSTWTLPIHAAAGSMVAILPLLRFARIADRRALVALAAAIAAIAGAGAALPYGRASSGYVSANRYYQDLASATPAEAGSALFPGFPRISGGRGGVKVASQRGGSTRWLWGDRSAWCASCHPAAVREWAGSSHRHAGFDDPYYVRALSIIVRRDGAPAARFCAGCHDPARLLSGADVSRAPAPGEPSGVTCLSCHSIAGFSSRSGNGAFIASRPGGLTPGAGPAGPLAWWQRMALKLYPAAHADAMNQIADRSALCGSCHRMSVNLALNHYKFVRVQDEYGAWLRSPESGREARSFYPLTGHHTTEDCVSCHMPGAGAGTIDHSFASGNTALRTLFDGSSKASATPQGSAAGSFAPGVIAVDLFSAKIDSGGHGATVAPLPASAVVPGGAEVVISVVVTNGGVGHTFPAGDTDARDCWLDLKARGSDGKIIGESGGVSTGGAVDPSAHRYGDLWLDRRARPVLDRNLEKAVTLVRKRLIAAGASDVVRYQFRMPRSGSITLTAALKYRSIGLTTSQLLGQTLVPPTTVMARAGVRLTASPHPIPASVGSHGADAARWNEYGIGCMLQGDAGNAASAFKMVQRLAPREPGGYVNLGRLYLEQGQPIDAARQFALALHLRPGDPIARAWLGQYYLGVGQYRDALVEFNSSLHAFPLDPTLWFDVGRSHFQRGEFQAAERAFQKSLELDPDQVDGHYQLMRTYLALHQVDSSHLERAIYLYLKDDESMDQVVSSYISRHPAARLDLLPTHVNTLRLARRTGG